MTNFADDVFASLIAEAKHYGQADDCQQIAKAALAGLLREPDDEEKLQQVLSLRDSLPADGDVHPAMVDEIQGVRLALRREVSRLKSVGVFSITEPSFAWADLAALFTGFQVFGDAGFYLLDRSNIANANLPTRLHLDDVVRCCESMLSARGIELPELASQPLMAIRAKDGIGGLYRPLDRHGSTDGREIQYGTRDLNAILSESLVTT